MAPTDREERRRMRQRGAGVGAITGGNFGFTFGGSAPALPRQPSSRRTPPAQPLPAQRSARSTPAALASRASSRRTPGMRRSASAEPSNLHKSASTQRSGKTPRQAGEEALLVTPTAKKSTRKSVQGAREAPDENQEDELEGNDEEYRTSVRKSRPEPLPLASIKRRTVATPRVALEEAEDELEQDDEDHALSTARKSRPSLELDRRTASPAESAKKRRGRPRKSLLGPAEEPASVASVKNQQTQIELPIHKKRGRPRKSDTTVATQSPAGETPKKAGRGRPRKSDVAARLLVSASTQIRQDQGEGGREGLSPARKQAAEARKRALLRSAQEEAEEGDEGDELDEDEAHDESEEEDEEEQEDDDQAGETDDELQDDQSRQSSVEIQHKARAKAPKPKPNKRKSTQDAAPRKRQKRSDTYTPGIPITVYRLSNPRRRQSVAATADDDEEDELAPTGPIMRAPAINAIDVLAQVTSEMTSRAALSTTNQAATEPLKPKRAELKRRAKTINAFAASLADRLFELTEAVNAGETLKSRLKSTRKEKAELRARFLELRQQREEVALRMDEVRARHTKAEEQRAADERLNDGICALEVAVQRGREREKALGEAELGPRRRGLGWRVEDLVGVVGGSGNTDAGTGAGAGGLLGRVRAFNSFLEGAAGVLEGRV